MLRLEFALAFAVAFLGPACGSDSSPAAGDGGIVGNSDAPSGNNDLFSDPTVPTCAQGSDAVTQITGTLAGQTVSLSEGGPSNLASDAYFSLNSAGTANTGGIFWYPLDLKWQGALSERHAVALTGGYISMTPDDPHGTYYCITSGDFGPEPLSSDAAVGRVFRFRITGAEKAGIPDGGSPIDVQCSTDSVPAKLAGCIYRTKTGF